MQRKFSARNRKGVVLMIMACALMFIVIPAVGLAIDGAVVYSVRAMLQSATDAAAVSAVQAYSRGLSPTAQQDSARTTAQRYFRANINAAWVPLTAPDPTITSVRVAVALMKWNVLPIEFLSCTSPMDF